MQGYDLPDVVLVRKSYEEKRRRRRAKGQQRPWRLKRMAVDAGGEAEAAAAAGPGPRSNRAAAAGLEQEQQDMERFLEVGWRPCCVHTSCVVTVGYAWESRWAECLGRASVSPPPSRDSSDKGTSTRK